MGETKRNGGRQKGAQVHDEHLHGDKTVSRIAENWNNPPVNENREATMGPRYDAEEIRAHKNPGRHRIFEGREQRDEADLNSEKTRLARDVEHHGHGADGELAQRTVRSTAERKS